MPIFCVYLLDSSILEIDGIYGTSLKPEPTGTKNMFHFLYVNDGDGEGAKIKKLRKIFLKFEVTVQKNIVNWRRVHGDNIPNLVSVMIKLIIFNHLLSFLSGLSQFMGVGSVYMLYQHNYFGFQNKLEIREEERSIHF